jgi:Hg(II)-responsive transcriptional regulator
MKTFTVGQLAKRTDINIETVRYYERRRLLPKPMRSESSYRQYTENDVARIMFIKRSKELGFTLKEISELLSLKLDTDTTCRDVKEFSDKKITDVEEKIRDLKRIKKKLEELLIKCKGEYTSKSECPILDAFETKDYKDGSNRV